MKEKLYKKEIRLTIVFSILLVLMCNMALIFAIFPGLRSGSMWGFPVEYIIPILTGWFGLALVCWLMAVVCNKFDDELEDYLEETSLGPDAQRRETK